MTARAPPGGGGESGREAPVAVPLAGGEFSGEAARGDDCSGWSRSAWAQLQDVLETQPGGIKFSCEREVESELTIVALEVESKLKVVKGQWGNGDGEKES